MKAYKITPCTLCNSHVEGTIRSALAAVEEWLEEINAGDVLTIEAIEITEDEFNNLPEYSGP